MKNINKEYHQSHTLVINHWLKLEEQYGKQYNASCWWLLGHISGPFRWILGTCDRLETLNFWINILPRWWEYSAEPCCLWILTCVIFSPLFCESGGVMIQMPSITCIYRIPNTTTTTFVRALIAYLNITCFTN